MKVPVRRLVLTGALAAGLGLAIPAVALAEDLAGPRVAVAGGVITMELDSTQTNSMFIPKNGSPTEEFPSEAPGVGDAVSFSESLYQGGTLVGTDKGVCTFEAFGTLACKVIATFADGTLNVAGRIAEDAEGPNSFDLVSGTGAYEGVDGGASVVDVDDTHSTITLRYTVPPTQVSVVPSGGARTGGGEPRDNGGTDAVLLIGVGVAAVVGSIGLFAAAQLAGRRD